MWHAYLTWYTSLPNIIKPSQLVWVLWPTQDFGFRGDKYITKKMRIVSPVTTPLLVLIYVFTGYYQNISNLLESYGVHKNFCLEICSGAIPRKLTSTKQELSFWHATFLLALVHVPTKYYQIISYSMGVTTCTRFWLQGWSVHNEESESCFSCTRHACWSPALSLPNMKAIHLRIKVTYNFAKRLTKCKPRTSNEIKYITEKWELSLLHATRLPVLLLVPTNYESIPRLKVTYNFEKS